MANYVIDNNGNWNLNNKKVTTNSKKNKTGGNNYIINSDGSWNLINKEQNKKTISENIIARKNKDISTISLHELQSKFKEEDNKLTNINKNIINTRNTLTKNALNEKGITSVLPTKEEVKKANQTSLLPGVSTKEILEKKKSFDAVSRANEVRKTQNDISKSKEVQELNKEHAQQESNTAWAEYDLNRKLIDEKKVTNYDKSIGRIGDAILSNFTQFGHDYQALDEEGNKVYLDDKYKMWDKKVSDSYDSKVGKFLGDALYQGSKILSSSALNTVIPGFGSGLYWTSMYSNSYDNAKSEGYDDINANLYATLSTVSEYVVGKWLGSATKKLTGGKTSQLSNAIKNGVSKFIKNNKVSSFLANAGSEATEEFLQEYIDVLNRQITLEKNVDITKLFDGETFKNALYSAGIGAVTGGILGGDVSSDVDNSNITNAQNNNIKLPGISAQNSISELKTNIGVSNSLLTYTKTDNEQINAMYESAIVNKFNNSESTKQYLGMLEKITRDKGVSFVFDSKLGSNINGKYKNGVITINPNSTRAGEFIAIHELTHAIGTNTMRNIVDNYRKSNTEFDTQLQSILKNYNATELTDEAMADAAGQLFGNQEFINNLSQTNPSLFKRIYNEIKYLWHQFTGYKNQNQFIEDLQYKWEQAYRSNQELNNSTNYHTSNDISKDIDNVLINITERNPVRLRDYTPSILVKNGIKDLPMYENPSHIRKNILTTQEAQKLGLSIMPNDHYHGLGKDLFIKAIDSLDNPRVIFKNKNNKDYLILTTVKDNKGNTIIVPLEIETTTFANNMLIDTNRIKSVYGFDNINYSLNNYIKHNINNKVFDKIYEQKKKSSTSNISQSTSVINNIPQNAQNVKSCTSTKYSMQENANNTQWQEYLEKNFPSSGTRTHFNDIKLPTKKDIDNINKVNLPMNNESETKTSSVKLSKDIDVVTENKTAQLLNKRPSTAKPTLKESYYKTIRQIVDKGEAISRLAKKTGNKDLYAKYDHIGTSDAEGQYAVAIAQTDNHGNKIGKSVVEIWKPVEDANLVEEFSNYLLHKHNIARWEQGKPVFGDEITSDMSRKFVKESENTYPQFIEWSKDINVYNRNQMQNMVDAGLTSQESQEYLNNTYDNYVKINRDIKGNSPITQFKGNLKVNVPIKKARGGNQDILPLKESMAQQTIEIKKAIRRNIFGLELLNVLDNGENVKYDGKQTVVKNDDGTYSFTVFKDGQPIKMEIDEGIYNALEPNKKHQFEETLPLKAIQKVSSIQRGLLTDKNPLFIATNFFKDIGDAPFNSKYASKFAKNYVVAANEIRKNGDLWNRYKALGGEQNTYFDYEKGVKLPSNKKISKFVRKISNANKIIEQLPRFTEFISTLESGGTEAEAMYNAAEITTNFKRGGELTKVVNRNGANFLNASIQGFDKQIRNFTGQNGAKGYINLLMKATILGVAPSVFNHMLLDDDEEYENLPDYVKDSYFLFKTIENKFIRIPKGRVVSIFGMAARRTMEYADGEKDAFKGMGTQIANQVAPNNPLTDNIFAPFISVSNNKAWHGGDIVPQRLQNELPENQYDESTDSISKKIGAIFKVSPKKINYLLDQYTGGIGDIILPYLTPEAHENPITSKFTVDSIMSNKNVSDFYNKKEELQKISNSTTATDEDILKSKYFNSVNSEMNELYKEKRNIQNSNLSNKEKMETVKNIQVQINDLAKFALEDYEDYYIDKNYASIGDKEYYKNSSGDEWTKVNNKQKEKQDYISEKYDITPQQYYEKREEYNYAYQNPGKYATITQITDYDNFQKYKEELKSIRDNTTNDKNEAIKYINSLNLTVPQKAMFIRQYYSSFDNYNVQIVEYINNQKMNVQEKETILKELGFTIKDGRVYW